MGYERKRGKLADLNSLLRGGSEDRFSLIIGKTEILSSIKYVITLDTDTQLPRDSARQFIGAMAHPLNRAVYDPVKKRVIKGYAIMQPRVAVILPSANHFTLCAAERERGLVLIRIPALSLTCIRICSMKDRSLAKEFMTLMRLIRH